MKLFELNDKEVIVNKETGEVRGLKKAVKVVDNQEEFMRVYTDDILALMRIKPELIYRITLCVWKLCDPRNNQIIMDKNTKTSIHNTIQSEGIKCSYNSICNAIPLMVQKNILIKIASRGRYILNPRYFFKGSSLDRYKSIQLVLQYQGWVVNDTQDDIAKIVINVPVLQS